METKKCVSGQIVKISETGNIALVAYKPDERQIGFLFGWCSRKPEEEIGYVIPNFKPKGTEEVFDKEGTQMFYPNGNPVLKWTF
jgi:hypothetical protein